MKLRLTFFILIIYCGKLNAQDNYKAWNKSCPISINTTGSGAGIATDVNNFPVLIRITSANQPHADFWDDTQALGEDIRFSKNADIDEHDPYEIERWDNAAEEAEIWVMVDVVAGNTDSEYLTMYWDNCSAEDSSSSETVFNTTNNFQGVWHLEEDGSTTANAYKDATANSYDLTGVSLTNASDIDGIVGRATTLDGNSDYLNGGDVLDFERTDVYTLNIWAFHLSGETSPVIAKTMTGSPYRGYDILWMNDGKIRTHLVGSYTANMARNFYGAAGTYGTGSWKLLTVTYDGSSDQSGLLLYVDGVLQSTTGNDNTLTTTTSNTADFRLGSHWGGPFHGNIDETRVSNIVRSAEWIELCFESQKATPTLVSFGAVTVSPDAPGRMSRDLVLWLKADAGTTGSPTVTAWADQSAAGNNSTANSNPQLVESGINYNRVIDFDGSNDYFSTTNTDLLFTSQAYTKLAVVMPRTLAGSDAIIAGSASSTHIFRLTSNKIVIRNATTNMENSTNSLQTELPYLVLGRYGPKETEIVRLNGDEDTPGNTTVAFDDGSLQIGCKGTGNQDFDGYIAEAIVYNQEMSANEIGFLESYLGIKYGITLDNSAGGTAGDYIATDCSLLWDADLNPSYHNNVIGIGRDDNQELYQKQSQTTDDTTHLYLHTLVTTNSANPGGFGNDLSYIVMGDNQGLLNRSPIPSAEIPGTCGLYSRLEREWKVTRTSDATLFNFDVKLNSNATPSSVNNMDIKLLIDDDGDFSNGGTTCYFNGDGSGVFITYVNPTITVSNISSAMIPDNSTRYMTIGSNNAATPLPVELIKFNAACLSEVPELTWTTTSEINNDYFTIERSTDGIYFVGIGTVKGNGNSYITNNYIWSDDSPLNGTSYYRLKQTDYNGATIYHNVVTVTCEQSTGISIYPNPFENSFTIQLSENTAYPITIEIVDYLGRTVYAQTIETNEAEITIKDQLSMGTYFVKVNTQTTQIVERVVKLK